MSKRDIARLAKAKGLVLQSKAVAPLVKLLHGEENPAEALKYILDAVKTHIDANPGTARIVDESTITSVIAELSKDEEDFDQERFQVCFAGARAASDARRSAEARSAICGRF